MNESKQDTNLSASKAAGHESRATNLSASKAVKSPFMDRYIVSGTDLRKAEQYKQEAEQNRELTNKGMARLLYQNAQLQKRLRVALGSKPKQQTPQRPVATGRHGGREGAKKK